MKFIDGKFLPQEDKTVILFGKTGNLLEDNEKHKLPHYTKIIQSSEGKETYFIRI